MSAATPIVPFPAPMKLSGNVATEWKRFRGQWENYVIAAGMSGETSARRAAIFLACVGTEAYELFQTLEFDSDDDKKDVAKIITAFENHCVGETNVTYERYVFNRRDQDAAEPFDLFLSEIRRLIRTCEYGELESSILRDRIVMGIRDDATRRKLLQTRKLDLKQAVDICKSSEAATKQLRAISHPEDVQAIRPGKERQTRRESSPPSRGRRTSDSGSGHLDRHRALTPARGRCKFCNLRHEFKKSACPAVGKSCNACFSKNHFANSSVCRSKDKTVCELEDDDGDILALEDTRRGRLYSKLTICNRDIRFLLDCGATVNLLPAALVKQCGPNIPPIRPAESTLRMFDNSALKTEGMLTLPVTHPLTGQSEVLDFYISTSHNQPLLGVEACLQFQLLSVNHDNICSIRSAVCTPLTQEYIEARYADILEGVGKIPGVVHLEVDPSIPPVRMPLRKLPVAMKEKVASELRDLQKDGIITPVNEPSAWISALLVVNKPSGGVRLCIDPKPLNKALHRDHYPMPTIDDILPELSRAKVFSTVDAKSAFWHLELDEESSKLTTFETPFRKFRWLRLPYGVSVAPEIFQRKMHEALTGLKHIACIADDILIFGCGEDIDEAQRDHDACLIALLDRCREKDIHLNKFKMRVNRESLSFMGHLLTSSGLSADNRKVEAIQQMAAPTDRQGVLRLLGMTTYLARYTPDFSEVTAPIRELLKRENEFRWDSDVHGKALDRLKALLSSSPVLQYYDASKNVVVQCDSSQAGLGACLLQDGRPVEYASRALTKTEQAYAQIEKELLACCFALERLHTYVYGRRVVVETDHKPLISIVKKALTTAPKRLQRMLLRLQRYDFELVYRRGSEVIIADALSRAYPPDSAVQTPFEYELASLIDDELAAELRMVASDATVNRIRTAAERDNTYQMLKLQILAGWPSNPDGLADDLKEYFPFADELVISGPLIYKGHRLLVPAEARADMLQRIHSSHIGVNGCIRRAREALFWPGMTNDIKITVAQCSVCQTLQDASHREPLLSHAVPDRPWAKVGVDIFTFHEQNYLILVDYLSGYFEVDRLNTKRVTDIVYCLKQQFARHGIPDIVFSDNSPFGAMEFKQFARNYEFEHQTSSPRYSQANGKVENAVRSAKRLMIKALEDKADPFLALLDWRNTPSEQLHQSPAQILFGRRTRTKLPMAQTLLRTPETDEARSALTAAKKKQAAYYNRNAREKPALPAGQTVRFKPDDSAEWRKGMIKNVLPYRSYEIQLEDGTTRRRTSKHVRFSAETPIVMQDDTDVPPRDTTDTPASPSTTPLLAPPTDAARNAPASSISLAAGVNRRARRESQSPDAAAVVKTRSGRLVVYPARYRE
jgi:hypothetical protein